MLSVLTTERMTDDDIADVLAPCSPELPDQCRKCLRPHTRKSSRDRDANNQLADVARVHTDDKTKASLAVWQLPRNAPKDQERITVTLSKAATSAANLRGQIRWAKPAPKTGPSQDAVDIAPAPL
jgi:hypothetical protein